MKTTRLILLATLLFTGALFSQACNDSAEDAIGAPCDHDGHCPPGGTCLTGGKYPGGTCTIPCNTHDQCPPHTACIDQKGGICLPGCQHKSECRPGYSCDNQKNRSGGGKTNVCIND